MKFKNRYLFILARINPPLKKALLPDESDEMAINNLALDSSSFVQDRGYGSDSMVELCRNLQS